MRRRILLALGASVVVWLAVASNLPADRAPAAAWSHTNAFAVRGISAVYPAEWHAELDGNMLLVWSRRRPTERSSDRATRIPDGAVWIWLMNFGRLPRMSGFDARPSHFDLRDDERAFQSCGFGFEGWNLTFADHGRAVQAIIGLGRGARKSDATELLDRLEIS